MSTTAVHRLSGRFLGAVHAALGVSILGLWMSGTTHAGAVLLLTGVLAWAVLRNRRGAVPSEREEFLETNTEHLLLVFDHTVDRLDARVR